MNTPPEGVELLIDRIRNAEGFDTPCPAFSYGWAQIPGDANEHDALMAMADQRMYEAKARR